jgi:hypothetical protein
MPTIKHEVASEMRGARLKYKGLEIPCLYFKEPHRVTILRSILTDKEAGALTDQPDWDYMLIAQKDIETDCIFPNDDDALYSFRSFLWQCPENDFVTVRPDTFRHVIENFKLDLFKTLYWEQDMGVQQTMSLVAEPIISRIRLYLDSRHIHIDKPIDWRGQFPTVDSPAITPRARHDNPFFTVLLHEDWTVERISKESWGRSEQ